MGKIIFINVLLFILGIVLFVAMAAGIGYAMGTDKHIIETDMAYIAVIILHLVINFKLLKKWKLNKPAAKVLTGALIAGAYTAYLFTYLLIYK
ncbi:MAG TPA: hypothetical protein VGM41_00675 [Chitinophagaceae bacterium]|jgi:hypothetical protein